MKCGRIREKYPVFFGDLSLTDLATLPSFLRFGRINITYRNPSLPIAEKCQLFDKCLQTIKTALNDSTVIRFCCAIDQNNPFHFNDHSTLICYLRNGLLPICGSCRYSFTVHFNSDKDAATILIASILQLQQINLCSSVMIRLFRHKSKPMQLLSNWLNQNSGENEMIGRKQQERYMTIYCKSVQNTQELCDHLKKVNFCVKYFYLIIFVVWGF